VNEVFPIMAGLLCGLLLGPLTARRRVYLGLTSAVVLGVLATIVSGEWRASWAFLLIDIPLVAISATAVSSSHAEWPSSEQVARSTPACRQLGDPRRCDRCDTLRSARLLCCCSRPPATTPPITVQPTVRQQGRVSRE